MITARLKIPLEEIEYAALVRVAMIELRGPTDQARMFIREGLERRGLLAPNAPAEVQLQDIHAEQGAPHVEG